MADDSHKEKTEKVQIPEMDVTEPAQESALPAAQVEKGTIRDLDPLHEIISDLLQSKKTEVETWKQISIARARAGIGLMYMITVFILVGLGYMVYFLLPYILDPTKNSDARQLATSIVSLILGGGITFLLTNVVPYFEKKD